MSLLTPMLRSSPLTAWFSDAQRVQGMLDFEAALVRAQASCGTVPSPPSSAPASIRPSIFRPWGWPPPARATWRFRW